MNTKWPIHDIRHCCFPGSSLCGSVGKGYNAAKFFDRSFAQFTPGTTYFGETIPPFERPDRVKNRSAVGMISGFPFLWRHARIQRVLQQPSMISMLVLGSTRVIIRPEHFFHIGRIDVLIDHNDITSVASGGSAAHGSQTCLFRASGVRLLDRHDGKIRRMIVHADDVLNSCTLQLIPEYTGARVGISFHRAGPQRRFLLQDGIVAMIDCLYFDDRLRFSGAEDSAGIVAGPFTEGPLLARLL